MVGQVAFHRREGQAVVGGAGDLDIVTSVGIAGTSDPVIVLLNG